MMDTELDQTFFAELSAFIASARKEGFSFKPSQIVKDKDYCNDVIATLVEKGSEALATSAIKVINRCGNLDVEHEITKLAQPNAHGLGAPELLEATS